MTSGLLKGLGDEFEVVDDVDVLGALGLTLATLNALGWHDFQIERQVAPGVVQMSATNGTLVTLKPGSYPWGELFQSFSE